MIETITIQNLINNNKESGKDSLLKLSTYFSSNKNYKYTSTYINDSEDAFNTFLINIETFRLKLISIYSDFFAVFSEISLDLFDYKIEVQINNAVTINSDSPDTIMLINNNESKFFSFLNQKTIEKYHITLIFNYSLKQFDTDKSENIYKVYSHRIEHTYFHDKKGKSQKFYRQFTNLIKLIL